ncbi:unnamed protein product [Rotaria magnacalcarata]|uniref:Uncharacterized protein n=2 Tax=Rotaria magnacalcarata TaxID=392030 RepID=A0A816F2R2_9BILA|nr:unnamed protein product [Rotaria magnacalcarata]CAF2084651.1 unnamed protein product [Rotaria magnacalcarata]
MSNSNSSADRQHLPLKIELSENILQRVDNRHWDLFETRLKNSLSKTNKENYTKSNDYGIVDPWKKADQSQAPIEPKQRWETFCSKLTIKSNETGRLVSIFRNIWINNWNRTQTEEKTNSNLHENNFLKRLSANEHDKKIISSILHQNI